jgi:hypothetical protein
MIFFTFKRLRAGRWLSLACAHPASIDLAMPAAAEATVRPRRNALQWTSQASSGAECFGPVPHVRPRAVPVSTPCYADSLYRHETGPLQ